MKARNVVLVGIGILVGAGAALASKLEVLRITYFKPTLDDTNDTKSVAPAVPTASPIPASPVPTAPFMSEDAELVDDTPEPSTASTLIDSLQDIEVAGDAADLVKVRVLGVERAKAVAMWGSKGQNHDEPTKFKRFLDLTTEHLLNIKNNSQAVTDDEIRIIDSILEDRVASGEADASVLTSNAS
jgi:hypothetical protein